MSLSLYARLPDITSPPLSGPMGRKIQPSYASNRNFNHDRLIMSSFCSLLRVQ